MIALAENWGLATTTRTKSRVTKPLLHLGWVDMYHTMSGVGECKYRISTLWVNR